MGVTRIEFIMENVSLASEYASDDAMPIRKLTETATFSYALLRWSDGDLYGVKFLKQGQGKMVALPKEFTIALMLKAFPEWI